MQILKPPWRLRSIVVVIAISIIFLYVFLESNILGSSTVLVPHDSSESTTKILLVSAYFPLSKSKHSRSSYRIWLANYLSRITTDIYFFTDAESEPLIRQLRGNLPITINTTFSSAFEVPPLKGLEEQYTQMKKKDREKNIHNIALYAVWNAKPYFLESAIQNSDVEYDYAFWNDAGAFRSHHHSFRHWPDPATVNALWKHASVTTLHSAQDFIFFPIHYTPHPSMQYWTQDMGPIDNEFSEGTFFGGHPSAIAWYSRTFYAYHNYYLNEPFSMFVGKDQTVINALFILFPDRFITVWEKDPSAPAHKDIAAAITDEMALGNCGHDNHWFYYEFYLAHQMEKDMQRLVWDGESRWWVWNPWHARVPCQVTRILWMRTLLERTFDRGWNPPRATLST